MIVADASATVELLLRTPAGEKVAARALSPVERLHAPQLIDIEIAQVLRRLVQLKQLALARAQEALVDLDALFIQRADHQLLLPRVWSLRESLSACDACYVALAEALAAPLLTCDGKLARSHGHRARIEHIA